MGTRYNEEHYLCFMLYLDNYVKKKEQKKENREKTRVKKYYLTRYMKICEESF